MARRHKTRKVRILTIMQANVGRGRISHHLALQRAHENNANVVLIQEPWISRDPTS